VDRWSRVVLMRTGNRGHPQTTAKFGLGAAACERDCRSLRLVCLVRGLVPATSISASGSDDGNSAFHGAPRAMDWNDVLGQIVLITA
jgi:hypothetical protein